MRREQKSSVRQPAGAAVLQSKVTDAITMALFREWSRKGLANVSMEGVAKRAGVGKAALYRRWPSKSAMVADLVTRATLVVIDTPDTGSLDTDIAELLGKTAKLFGKPMVAKLLPDLHAESRRSPELTNHMRSKLMKERRASSEEILRRAINRGELSPTMDLEIAIDLIPALLYWRLIVNQGPRGPKYLEDLTRASLAALRAL